MFDLFANLHSRSTQRARIRKLNRALTQLAIIAAAILVGFVLATTAVKALERAAFDAANFYSGERS